MKISKEQLRRIIQEELSTVNEIKASDGAGHLPTWMRNQQSLSIPQDLEVSDTVISEPIVPDRSSRGVDTMKKLFKRQMKHRIIQFLDLGQEEANIIKAATEAAEEIVADQMSDSINESIVNTISDQLISWLKRSQTTSGGDSRHRGSDSIDKSVTDLTPSERGLLGRGFIDY